MNNGFLLKITSDELRETLYFCNLIADFNCKIKEKDEKGKTRYRLKTLIGDIYVYSPKVIYIKGNKFTSIDNFKRALIPFILERVV